jgi:hypothetical protein
MEPPLIGMLATAKISTEQLIEAVNRHPGRESADRDLLVVAVCSHCGGPYPSQPQDVNKQRAQNERSYCFRRACRQELRRLQAEDRRRQRGGTSDAQRSSI